MVGPKQSPLRLVQPQREARLCIPGAKGAPLAGPGSSFMQTKRKVGHLYRNGGKQLWLPKDERTDKTKEGLGMQEWENQTPIILPSPVL